MNKLFNIKQYFLILSLVFLVGFLVFPQKASAEIQLSVRDSHYLLNSVQQGLIDNWINIITSSSFSKPREQATMLLVRKAIQQEEFSYALKELPKEGLESLVKIAVTSYFAPDAGAILERIEKETVKKAVEIATDWFLQNEVKVSSGKLIYTFVSYAGDFQESVFYYNLTYRRLDNKYAEAVIGFYSPSVIELPEPTTGFQWEFKKEDKNLEPFVVRIKGKVSKTSGGGYKWEETLEVETVFSEPMPGLSKLLKEEPLIAKIPILGRYYRDLKNEIEKTKALLEVLRKTESAKNVSANFQNITQNIKDSAGSIIDKMKSYFSRVNPFSPAALVQQPLPSSLSLPSSFDPAELEKVEEEIATLEEEIAKVAPEQIEKDLESGVSLAEIQEKLDDIEEKSDIVNQKIVELAGVQQEVIEIVEIEEETEETSEMTSEEITKENLKETEQEETGQVFCEKVSGILPKRNRIIINEIAWMGTINSANDEWIELRNISGNEINLSEWQIIDGDGQIEVTFGENDIISANGFYLLERTDDSSVPGVTADLIYTGTLNDESEELYLFSDSCILEDEIIASFGWPAGDKSPVRKTMERENDLSWCTCFGSIQNGILGTPRRINSARPIIVSGGITSSQEGQPSPSEILITEVQIGSEKSSYDFVELYNPATNSLDISGFQLKKKGSAGKDYSVRVFPQGSIVLAQSYFLWVNSDYASSAQISADITSTQTLAKNNSVALFDKDENILDAIAWGSSSDPFVENFPFSQNPGLGQSLGRKWNEGNQKYQDVDNNQEDFEIQVSTPGKKNESSSTSENQLPIALFTFISQDLTVGQEITFDAASSTDEDGKINSFIWDFGDNNSTTTGWATTSYSYSTSSSYMVSLMVVDDKGATSSPATTTIVVSQPVLEINPSILTFETEEGGSLESKTLAIQNISDKDLDWTVSINYNTTSTSTNWLSVDVATGTTLAFASSALEVLVDVSGLSLGSYEAFASIESLITGPILIPIDLVITVKSFPPLSVAINEIAWMGTRSSANDEWIELYNNTDEDIILDGWKIKAVDGMPEVDLLGTIPAKDYFLLERTDDQAISDIGADQIYTGALGNEGESLELRDPKDKLIDFVDCPSEWFAGRNQKIGENWVRMSMERVDPEASGDDSTNWITNSGFITSGKDSEDVPLQGTPARKNSCYNSSGVSLRNVTIARDMIWTKKGGPYIIGRTLTIPENITVFIESGTVIELVINDDSRIEIKGTLKAIGLAGDPVVFTSNREKTTGAGPGFWNYMYFTGPDSILDNVIVKYGGFYRRRPLAPVVIKGTILVENTDITINNSIIENNLVAGVWLNNSNSLIENTVFRGHNKEYSYMPRSPGFGITVAIFLGGSSNPTLNNLTFEENTINIYPIP